MRKILNISENWNYTTDKVAFFQTDLPYICKGELVGEEIIFSKTINIEDSFIQDEMWLEITRLTGSCSIFADSEKCFFHPATINLFRCNLGEKFTQPGEHTIEIRITPSCENNEFFIGSVNLISVSKTHFMLSDCSGSGIHIKTFIGPDSSADVHIKAMIAAPNNYDVVKFVILSPQATEIASKTSKPTANGCVINIENPELWSGQHESYMYTLKAEILRDTVVLDEVSLKFAVRNFEFDKEGFLRINGMKRLLNGVSFNDEKNLSLDRETFVLLDANTAHLTHRFFYDDILSTFDEAGVLVWFSFPCKGNDEDFLNIEEFVKQNSHHPSLSFISYPIECDTDWAKRFVKTVKDNSLYIFCAAEGDIMRQESINDVIPDILSFRVCGKNAVTPFSEIESRFAELRQNHPEYRFAVFADAPECIYDRHSLEPKRNDCSQEYFSLWHEKLWNIFCRESGVIGYFAGAVADTDKVGGRSGFVTVDRKIKKDALWFYKAQFSADEFVRLCSSDLEFVNRKYIDVKCYTNVPPVNILVNGKKKKKYRSHEISDCVYVFNGIKLKRKYNKIEIIAGTQTDTTEIFRSNSKLKKV